MQEFIVEFVFPNGKNEKYHVMADSLEMAVQKVVDFFRSFVKEQ